MRLSVIINKNKSTAPHTGTNLAVTFNEFFAMAWTGQLPLFQQQQHFFFCSFIFQP